MSPAARAWNGNDELVFTAHDDIGPRWRIKRCSLTPVGRGTPSGTPTAGGRPLTRGPESESG